MKKYILIAFIAFLILTALLWANKNDNSLWSRYRSVPVPDDFGILEYFAPMDMIDGKMTAYRKYNPKDGDIEIYFGGDTQVEHSDIIYYEKYLDVPIPETPGTIRLIHTMICKTQNPDIPQQVFHFNDGTSYTAHQIVREVATNCLVSEIDGIRIYESKVEFYDNDLYFCIEDIIPVGGIMHGAYIADCVPGRWEFKDELTINPGTTTTDNYQIYIRGIYNEGPDEVTPDEDGNIKINMHTKTIPTWPSGDGFDEDGWSQTDPAWKFWVDNGYPDQIVYSTSGVTTGTGNDILTEINWDGKDNDGNPLEPGYYPFHFATLDQGSGQAYGSMFTGWIILEEEPVLELYDENDNLIASSIDPTIKEFPASPYYDKYFPAYINFDIATIPPNPLTRFEVIRDINDRETFRRIYSIFQRKHDSPPSQITVKLKNITSLNESLKIQVKAEKSQPNPQSVTLTLKSDGTYSGIFRLGSNGLIPIKKFVNSYTAIDSHVELEGINDSNLFCAYHPIDDGTDNGYKQLGFAHNLYSQMEAGQVICTQDAIKSAGYEDVIATYIMENKMISARLHVANQASELYFNGHGYTSGIFGGNILTIYYANENLATLQLMRDQYFICSNDNSDNLKNEWQKRLNLKFARRAKSINQPRH